MAVEARFATRVAAEEALVDYRDTGHPWNGMTAYRVLRSTEPGIFERPDGVAYWPKEGSGF